MQTGIQPRYFFPRVPEFCPGRFNFASVFSRKHKFCLERFNLYLGTFSRERQFCLDNLNSPSKLPRVSNPYATPCNIKVLLHTWNNPFDLICSHRVCVAMAASWCGAEEGAPPGCVFSRPRARPPQLGRTWNTMEFVVRIWHILENREGGVRIRSWHHPITQCFLTGYIVRTLCNWMRRKSAMRLKYDLS